MTGRAKIGSGSALGALLALLLLTALVGAPSAGSIGFVHEWGESGSGPGQFAFPSSVAIDPTGTVYVADSENDRVQIFTEAGDFLGQIGSTGSGQGQFITPEAIAFSPAGDFFYVADKGNYRIQKFAVSGVFVHEWGTHGAEPGQFESPEGIAVDSAGNVYVADSGNNRIAKFNPEGTFLTQWGVFGTGSGQLNAPNGVAVDPAGNVYVANSGNDRVEKFTVSGAFLGKWGKTGDGPGELDFPVAVATDAAGKVYVADVVNDRIEVFDASGKFLSQWGSRGRGPGQFDAPVAVAAASSGKVFVADGANNRIQVFGKLAKPEYGKTFNVTVVSGTIVVKLPGTTKSFVLTGEQQLPVGAIIDASNGRIRLTSARGPGGGSQSADFFSGAFRVLQPKGGKPLTVLKLENAVVCPSKKGKREREASALGRTGNRGLWGSGKGNFQSRGKHGSATVRGTIWWAQDTCEGTLFKVKRGVVTIRDFSSGRTLKLHAGQRYLAPNG